MFFQFTVGSRKAQKYLLGVFEMLVGEYDQLMSKVPHILKSFYDHDIVEEEALLEWADKVWCVCGRARVCANLTVFVDVL